MLFMGAGCKLIQDTGLKKVWSTVYKENSLPEMLDGKAYSHCLRACFHTDTDTALPFTLLCSNNHSYGNEENHNFGPIQTFDNNEEFVDFVYNGIILDCLDNNEQLFDNTDFEEDSIYQVFEVLGKLCESLEKQEVSLDEECNHPVIGSIGDIVGNLKFVQNVS